MYVWPKTSVTRIPPRLEDQRILAERFHLREIDHHPRSVGYRLLDHRPAPFRSAPTPPSRHRL